MHLKMIYDRTQNDILNDTDKAYIDYKDLNRVEEACKYLGELLKVPIVTKTWAMEDYRTEKEMERLGSNLVKLREAYNEPHYPKLGAVIQYTSIREANDVERLLHDIEQTYNSILSMLPRLSFKIGEKPLGNRGG